KQLLDSIFELIGLVLTAVLDPRPVMAELRGLHRLLDDKVVDAIEFKREEQEMHGRRRDTLRDIAIEFRNRRIDRIAGVNEAGEGYQPPREIVDHLITFHGA